MHIGLGRRVYPNWPISRILSMLSNAYRTWSLPSGKDMAVWSNAEERRFHVLNQVSQTIDAQTQFVYR